jgi:FkbM family methyltransferase
VYNLKVVIKFIKFILSYIHYSKFRFFKRYYKTIIFNNNFIHFNEYENVVKKSLSNLKHENYKYYLINKNLNESNKLILIDIGAAVGLRTIIINNYFNFKKIISIEPHIENFKLLKQNTKHLRDKLDLHNFALGNEEKEGYLSYPFWCYKISQVNHLGKWSLLGENNFFKKKVKIFKFDIFFKDCFNSKKYSYFIKIDVEGYETYVLEGMNEFLFKNNNIVIEIEFNKKFLRYFENEEKKIIESLKKNKFEIFFYNKNLKKLEIYNNKIFLDFSVIDLIAIKSI